MAAQTFYAVLAALDAGAQSTAEKGSSFERLVKAFLERDKAQQQRFTRVWLWRDWPGSAGQHDTGIDIVAEERESGALVGIQCKFYGPGSLISLAELNKFLARLGGAEFSSGIFVSTTPNWTGNAEKMLQTARTKPVSQWGPEVFEQSSIDWQTFDLDYPAELIRRPTKELRDYQETAVSAVQDGFEESDRGKLIMACGSGKTFTALRIAERIAGAGKTVLFLTPSISLLSQSLIDWANDADLPLKPFAVCSDIRAGRRSRDDEDLSPYDLTETPSTDPERLAARFRQTNRAANMTVVFSTYQSLNVVADAQKLPNGLPEFDLIICDEAHRTTGVSLVGRMESNFQRVHDNEFIAGRKRLYMTATPRIYGDRAKRKAQESNLTSAVASMDDRNLYGPEFHRLGFGQAVELGILSPYKVLIFNVDQEQVGIDLDALLSDDQSEVNMDNGARMVGCWNGLGKRGAAGVDFTADPRPMRRAVAFSTTIRQSKLFTDKFPSVVESCIAAAGSRPGDADGDGGGAENPLRCDVHHVDGTQHALARADRLNWLREEPEPGVCKILSNARCLTEGIDVPALDAVLFLQPRRSDIDVVQAVGRVMRKSAGKEFGYIILPIAQAPGATAQESIDNSAYKAVWQVINAISAHDDRFEAQINQLALRLATAGADDANGYGGAADIGDAVAIADPADPDAGIQGTLLIAGSPELRDAILAKIVDKYADPGYWEKWAVNIREIAERHEARIRALLHNPDSGVRPIFDDYLAGIRNSLNDGVSADDAIGMLSQHLITKPVFDALFADYEFAELNPVSQAMQATIESLHERGLEKETEGLEGFYRDVRIRARGVNTAAGRQRIIAELYERFLKLALPDTAARLGIVYTPVPVVDYIIRSVADILESEFDAALGDAGVHIIDPFVGTGTFITRLMQSGLIDADDLPRKYGQELHANDIMLLAYYIAAVNIEAAYHDLAGANRYEPFGGVVLTDTFQSYEPGDPMDTALFPRNNARIERQKTLDIRVVVGNPPWSATNNRVYPHIRGRVQESYAARSDTNHLSALYDPYVQAFRLASDWVQQSDHGGIVAFVTNGGFIASNAFDGFRKAIADEFHAIYCYNLRGDARTAGNQRQREGGGVFDAGSRAGVAILLLVKKPGQSPGATLYYRDIGDYLPREDKLAILSNGSLTTTDWQVIAPNAHGDWIGQRSAAFQTLRPLAADANGNGNGNGHGNGKVNGLAPIFRRRTLGLVTARDAWCYNSSQQRLRDHIARSVAFYNEQAAAFQAAHPNPSGTVAQRTAQARAFIGGDSPQFHWDAKNYGDLANGVTYAVADDGFTAAAYRPFFKQRLYCDSRLNNSIRDFPQLYPRPDADNRGIYITGPGSSVPFTALMTNTIADSGLTSGNGSSPYIPRWRYVPAPALTPPPDADNAGHPELERISNINPAAVADFRAHYADPSIDDDDLFYYTYGILHSPQYRAAFAADLSKSHARIPMAATAADFRAFADAGRQLAELHVGYESVEPYPLYEIPTAGWDATAPHAYRVQRMAYGGSTRSPDRTRIVYNAGLTLAGIPAAAHDYVLGARSALDWLLERYRVTTHTASGIVNDPNDWCAETGNPRYIVDLVKRVTTVAVRTVEVVEMLPGLPIDD